MKKLLAVLCFMFFMLCTSVSLEFYVCSKNVKIEKAPTISDYIDAQLAIRETTNLLEEHGYPVTLKGKLIFDEDPIGRFKNERQLGYTISATRVSYVRSYNVLNSLPTNCFYNTNDVYQYHDFNRSIIVHELTHIFLFQHYVRGTAIHEFTAYYFGLASLTPELIHKVLKANKDVTAFDSEKDAFCPLWYFVGYYPSVKAYLYWKHLPPKERVILFKKIVTRQFVQRRIGE